MTLAPSPAAVRASQSVHYVSKERIPSGERGEGLRPRGERVPARALERQNILAEVVGRGGMAKNREPIDDMIDAHAWMRHREAGRGGLLAIRKRPMRSGIIRIWRCSQRN